MEWSYNTWLSLEIAKGSSAGKKGKTENERHVKSLTSNFERDKGYLYSHQPFKRKCKPLDVKITSFKASMILIYHIYHSGKTSQNL